MPPDKEKSCEECGNISHSNQTNSAPFESKVMIAEEDHPLTSIMDYSIETRSVRNEG